MLFFSKHKKQGADVGKAIKQTLIAKTNAFLGSKMLEVPAVALADPYVVGFVVYFSVMSIDMVYKGAFWSSKKRFEFLVECWQKVGLTMDNIYFYTKVMGGQSEEFFLGKEDQYLQGKDAAALVFGSAYEILTAKQIQSDIVLKAKKKAALLAGIDAEIYIDTYTFEKSILSAAVCEITIQNHMKQYYPVDAS